MSKLTISFLQSAFFPTFDATHFTYITIKSKATIFEESMTPFWKEERQGYNIYQNKRN
jgi:hypothetical protein